MRPLQTVLVACAVFGGGACAQRVEPEAPRDPAAIQVAPPQGGEFKTADDLLTTLEEADAGLNTLTAKIVYDRTEVWEDDRQVRTGTLYFRSDPQDGKPPQRRFRVDFDKLYLGERLEPEPKQYIFDGAWMAEKMPMQKICNRQQVVAPGEHFDPLRIGEGPLPIPIGQRKAEILSRFHAELVQVDSGLMPSNADELTAQQRGDLERLMAFARAPGTWQIRLTPREGADARVEFSEVRLWYRRDKQGRLLPHMARTVRASEDGDGDVSIVQLLDVKTNDKAPVDPAIFDTEIPPGWDGRVEPWREAGGG